MKKEIFSKWQELGIYDTIKNLGQQKYPDSNCFPQKIQNDGLVEMSVEQHEGMDDEHPRVYMRVSFDGDNLVVRTTQNENPKLSLITTNSVDSHQLIQTIEKLVLDQK